MAEWSKLPYDIIHKVVAYLEANDDFLAFSSVCHSWRSVYLAKRCDPGPQVPLSMLSGRRMADWSLLPYDMIHNVASYLEATEDFLSFSIVCRSWRSVYLAKQWQPGPQVPLLMLSNNSNKSFRRFFSLYKNKVYNSALPRISDRRCFGTCSDWLVTIGSDLKVNLFNPSTRVCKGLPVASSIKPNFGSNFPRYDIIDKAYVFKKPHKEELLIFVIFGPFNHLAFCKPCYSCWRTVGGSHSWRKFKSVACLKDQIFALHDMGNLVSIEINNLKPKVVHDALPFTRWTGGELFLVESSGSLLMVNQCQGQWGLSVRPMNGVIFFAWRFDFSQMKWVELRELGNQAIFLGDGCSMSVSKPERFNCKSNSIYFVAKKSGKLYAGVYNMTSRIAEPVCYGFDIEPVWVIPTSR